MSRTRIFLDMDGPLANIHEVLGPINPNVRPPEILEPGFFRNLNPTPGAIIAVQSLLMLDCVDLFIATKTPRGNHLAASEKMAWIEEHFPALDGKVFITPDKAFLKGDYLLDDQERWKDFEGKLVIFDVTNPLDSWNNFVMQIF
jgi:5'(3')-deoxyribonucleotidase